MEKFSAFRDPGTGIQPFLPPVPHAPPSALLRALVPLQIIVFVLRTALLLVVIAVCGVLGGVSLLLSPVPVVNTAIRFVAATLFIRASSTVLGFWISEEIVTLKRTRSNLSKEWSPKRGDLIVSNWLSWIELIWLSARFGAVFVLPITEPFTPTAAAAAKSSPISSFGRRTGTGSAAISIPPPVSNQPRAAILGFRQVSLWEIMSAVGKTPPCDGSATTPSGGYESLDSIRGSARGPVAVFPECTTSNGRALLRFAEVFGSKSSVPVKGYNVWVLCIRYDAPSTNSPTLTQSVPAASSLPNPLQHAFSVAFALSFQQVSMRLLNSTESPSSATFIASDFVTGGVKDQLAETCASLIAQMGRLRRTQMGWEDKVSFLDLYSEKRAGTRRKQQS